MVPPKKTSLSRKNPPDIEPSVTSTIGTIGTSNPIEVTGRILSSVTTSTSLPTMVVMLPPVLNIPTTSRTTQALVGDLRPPYVPSFTLPLVTRYYPYDMLSAMIAGLQSYALTFGDKVATIDVKEITILIMVIT